MKKLIAVMTCFKQGYPAKVAALRDTWVPAVRAQGTDVVFFYGARHVGSDVERKADEVWLEEVRDDYRGIPLKVQAICAWAAERNYDYISKCDDDVYVVPNRYEVLPLYPYDYIGRFRGPCGNYPASFASGFFYTLSLKAAKVVAATPWNNDWMDERFVANSLAVVGIYGNTDPANYLVTGPFHPPVDLLRQNVSQRNGTAYCQYGPDALREMHACFADATPVPSLYKYLRGAPRAPVTRQQLYKLPTDSIPVEKLRV